MEDTVNKKQFILLVWMVVSVTFTVYAQQGGYKGSGTISVTVERTGNLNNIFSVILHDKLERLLREEHNVTVEESRNFRNISSVILQGKIKLLFRDERYDGARYLFYDDTGEITLIIGDGKWGNVSVDENDTVEIRGVIIRNRGEVWGSPLVAVKSIRKL
jgi:uncharacterized protein (TIGR00156 family)